MYRTATLDESFLFVFLCHQAV